VNDSKTLVEIVGSFESPFIKDTYELQSFPLEGVDQQQVGLRQRTALVPALSHFLMSSEGTLGGGMVGKMPRSGKVEACTNPLQVERFVRLTSKRKSGVKTVELKAERNFMAAIITLH